MDPIPLFPKNKHPENHDMSCMLREVFQDVLTGPEFPENVAKNVEQYNVENQSLKANGARVIQLYDNARLCMEDGGDLEDDIMVSQGTFMKEKDIIDKDEILTECVKLKRKDVFTNLDPKKVQEYGLLQKTDLLDSKPEISMDFRINTGLRMCPLTRANEEILDFTTPKSLNAPRPTHVTDKELMDFKRNLNRLCLPSQQNDLDLYPTKLAKTDRKSISRRHTKHTSTKRRERVVIFKAEPDTVTFENYEVGTVYEKTFKMRNITKSIQSFIPRILPKTSFFKVELQTGSTRVAPGMCAVFSVKYFTDIYKDAEEVMTFNTYAGCDVDVVLISTRKSPKLTAFVFKSIKHFTRKFTPIEELDAYDQGRALALNSTIDCGSCLLGNKLNFNLILKNEGNHGRFFIINEDDWYLADITAVSKNMELISRAFHVYPTYFEINTDEFVELDITFFPVDAGLEVEKLFLLCNNNTLEELEVVGDGVLYEISSITIEAESKLQNMLNMDSESNYCLKYGKCIPYQKRLNAITIHNNSVVDFKYKWIIRESICHIKGTTLKKLDPSWIIMEPTLDYIPAQSTFDFPLILECRTKETGFYSLVFTLYILDIPEASLAEDTTFYVIEEPKPCGKDKFAPKVVNILAGEIEVSCEVVPVHLQTDPENIIIPYILSYEEVFNQKIQIYTAGPCSLECEWKPPKLKSIEICPAKFTLNPLSVFICNLTIHVTTYEDIQETVSFVVNDDLLEKKCNIIAKVVKPVARFSENLLNFGYIPKGKTIEGKDFFVENVGQEKLKWEIFEFYFDHRCNIINELKASKHLTLTRGELDKNEKCKVTYIIDNTNQQHRWLSFLVLLSSHPTLEAMNSLCLITYEVIQPEIIIHTRSSQQPILYPGKLLHLNCTTFYMVCLHNVGTKLAASFIWGKPVGKQADNIIIKCLPKSGIVQPQKCVHISITLQPLATGILDEIYVPCFVGNMDEPIMLTVLCVVDNICLHFHLPDNMGKFEKVLWPPIVVEDFDSFSLDMSPDAHEMEDDAINRNELYEKNYGLQSTRKEPIKLFRVEELNNPSIFNIGDGLLNREKTLLSEEVDEDHEMHVETSDTSFDLEGMHEKESTESVNMSVDSLQRYFGSELILQEHLVQYHNVPLRTPFRKTIVIENLTPVGGNVSVEATNFYALSNDDTECNKTNNVLAKLNIKKKDEWEESINCNFGIVVRPKPEKGLLAAHGMVEIDIWVYANTWGIYVEEILIEVNDIAPFCFSLLIQVVGIPIEFPITLNTNSNQPIVRFGNIPYLSKPCQRKLKISNFSCVPICLVWHVFLMHDISKRKRSKKDPFNVVIDTFNANKTDSIELLVTNEYYGKEDFCIFEIHPRETIINSKSTETIMITLNTDHFQPNFIKANIQANLIGFVHLAEEFMFQYNFYSRQTGIDILPAKVQLLATLELPLLKLELVKGDKQIKAYANDIIKAQEIRYERVLVFRNVDNAPATVYMHIMEPFHVVCVRTAQTDTIERTTAAIVQPGECVEVILECIIDAEEVLQYSDMLYNEKTTVFPEIPDFKHNSVSLLRYLNIHQHGLKKQITSMELTVLYPKMQISHKNIDFGTVYVGNTKKMLITLTNTTGSYIPFVIHKPIASSVITIIPNEGTIPKATATTPSTVILYLYFVPTECKMYQETIQILTNIPFYYFNVELVGSGTNDEKFYIEGT